MTISCTDFWSFITELVTRNPNLGIPALEDGLFANLLIFNYLYYIFLCGKGKEGKKEWKSEFGRVSTGLNEFRRVPNEIRRAWTSFDEIDYKSKVCFSKTSSHSWQYK